MSEEPDEASSWEAPSSEPTGPSHRDASSRRILTVPNALSLVRILLIPVFVLLLVDEGTRLGGFLLMAGVLSTDWVDGVIARRTGQVTELGKLLDPFADRLAVIAALVTLIALDLFPPWAGAIVVVRDVAVGVAGALLVRRGTRIDVRKLGKYATFTLMWGMPMIAWGNAGLPFDDLFLVLGWVWFPVGVVEYYAVTVLYARDVREERRAAALART